MSELTKLKDNQFQIIRTYNAPLSLVWKVWTDLDHVQKWWGPRGFSITTKSKNFSPGGKWIYTMHGPDGVDYPNIATYHEIIPMKKIVYDHGGNEERQKLFSVDLTLSEANDLTQTVMIMSLDTAEQAREIQKFIKQAGGNSTWDRLAEYLDKIQDRGDNFFINRSFKMNPSDLMKKWTDLNELSKWMGPAGSSMEILNGSIAEGKSVHYKMIGADGTPMFGMINYLKIDPQNKQLVYTQNFCDQNGKVCKPPFAPTWPNYMLTTIHFISEGQSETRINLKWQVHGEASSIERETFSKARDGMTIGWTGSFDRLDEVI